MATGAFRRRTCHGPLPSGGVGRVCADGSGKFALKRSGRLLMFADTATARKTATRLADTRMGMSMGRTANMTMVRHSSPPLAGSEPLDMRQTEEMETRLMLLALKGACAARQGARRMRVLWLPG